MCWTRLPTERDDISNKILICKLKGNRTERHGQCLSLRTEKNMNNENRAWFQMIIYKPV